MRQNERGSVFIYIFMAIALLAALSFAVSVGGRVSENQLSQDTRKLLASEIIGYSDVVAKAVTQLRLRGTTINTMSFANNFLSAAEYGTYNNDPGNEIFNPTGGAVVYQDPPDNASTTGSEAWNFLTNNEIQGIGSTCGTANGRCSDLIMVMYNVKGEVCTIINDLLGVNNPASSPPTDSNIREDETFMPVALPASPFGYDETIGDEDTALERQAEACFEEGGSRYIYYKVLIPR